MASKKSKKSSKGKLGKKDIKKTGALKKQGERIDIHPETMRWIKTVFLFALAAITALALFNLAGTAGVYLLHFMQLLFGKLAFLFPILFILGGTIVIHGENSKVKIVNYIGCLIFILSLTALLNIFIPLEGMFDVLDAGGGGGYVGLVLSYASLNILKFWASLVVIVSLLVIGFLLTFNTSVSELADSDSFVGRIIATIQTRWYDLRYGELNGNDDSEYEDEEEYEDSKEDESEEDYSEELPTSFTKKALQGLGHKKEEALVQQKAKIDEEPILEKPKKKVSYKKVDLPLDLLEESSGKASTGNVLRIKDKIKSTLESFNIEVEMGTVNIGPTFTQYELIPADGVKLSRITALQDDLALALAAHPLRMEAPIPGKSAVGVEVPNTTVAMVRLKELLMSKKFKTRKSNLEIPLGKDVSGRTWTTPLEKMPHLLVAGATGSGKSVCLNTIITSLLYQNGPDTLRFIMVDPKKVELTMYHDIPHLLTPVITDIKKTINALKWSVAEMDRRYNLLQKMGTRNIESYNQVVEEKMPYIVFVIDEMADLMVSARNDVETLIIRLAQMSRAVGIHLVLATQRPSVDVITGLLKANIPTRIAFAVASVTDSRTILDSSGADKLIGKGDMLFSNPEFKKPVRIQGAFLSEEEVKRVVDYLHDSGQRADYNDEVVEKKLGIGGNVDFSDPDEGDEYFDEARQIVIAMGKASTSLLQRKLKIGYSRAARIMDILEEAGVVGASDGSRPREILVNEREVEDFSEGFDIQDNELQPNFDDDEDEELEAVVADDDEIEEALEVLDEIDEDDEIQKEEEIKTRKSVEESESEDEEDLPSVADTADDDDDDWVN